MLDVVPALAGGARRRPLREVVERGAEARGPPRRDLVCRRNDNGSSPLLILFVSAFTVHIPQMVRTFTLTPTVRLPLWPRFGCVEPNSLTVRPLRMLGLPKIPDEQGNGTL
ncbi:unnamed protein product [Urochloa humidicola]